ncbi:MAG: hypothetical protein ABL952_17505, partial [Pyrinomonadaceae bacterium]
MNRTLQFLEPLKEVNENTAGNGACKQKRRPLRAAFWLGLVVDGRLLAIDRSVFVSSSFLALEV